MNGFVDVDERTWTEKGNSFVRWALAIMFGGSVCYGFLWGRVGNVPLVSPDTFSAIAMAVILWWFDKEKAKEKAKEAAALVAAATATPPTPGGSANAPSP